MLGSSPPLRASCSSRVLSLVLNRPAHKNALSQEVATHLRAHLGAAQQDPNIHVVVISGAGSCFCSTADIRDVSYLEANGSTRRHHLEDLWDAMRSLQKPILAAIEGSAFGDGFDLALMCDMTFAATTSKFGLPEVKLGLMPDASVTQRLCASIGKYKAMSMLLLGSQICAQEACKQGLITELFPAGEVLFRTLVVALTLATSNPTAICAAKNAITRVDLLSQIPTAHYNTCQARPNAHDLEEGTTIVLKTRRSSRVVFEEKKQSRFEGQERSITRTAALRGHIKNTDEQPSRTRQQRRVGGSPLGIAEIQAYHLANDLKSVILNE